VKVGWLQDPGNGDGSRGGAELTMDEFKRAAPDGVEVLDCPAGGVGPGLDAYVVGNCVTYTEEDLWATESARVVKYVNDVMPHVDLSVKAHLFKHARLVFCSPLQATYMGFPDGLCVPPALDLDPFRQAAKNASERRGSVTVGAWMNWGKSPERAREVAPDVEFFGSGPCAPAGSVAVEYEALPKLLARYRTFIYLPSVLEPFGRAVVEAWAAGLQVVTNRLVGARHWINEQPSKLETAAGDFWGTVCD
jgi:hypothetical protein